jgi:hypothetical protein
MEYSVNRVGSGLSQVKPLQYGLSNQSVTSASFAESLQAVGGSSDVGLVSPIQYPNARVVSPIEKAEEGVRVSKAFNEIAGGFEGVNNGYGRDRQGTGYDVIGATVDVYV